MAEEHITSVASPAPLIAFGLPSFSVGGGERVTVDLANAFVKRGYRVDLVVFNPVGPYATQVDAQIRVISLKAWRIIFSLPKMIRYLRHERPQALLALDNHVHILAIVARMISGVETRIVLRIGNMLSVLFAKYTSWNDRLIPVLCRMLYHRADAVIAVSQGVARDVAQTCNVLKEKITVIFNPKNIERIRLMSREPVSHKWLGDNKALPVIIASGRLRPQKGFEDLFEAFAVLNRRVPSRLIIVGPGGKVINSEFVARVEKLGIASSVDFVGYVSNPHAYIALADVFVMPSLWEGLPNALIEALICGTPVVSADCDSGPREILAPDTDPFTRIKKGIEWTEYGALVPVHGIAEIAESLEKILADVSLREKYARAASKRAEIFDEAKIVDDYLRVIVPSVAQK